MYKSRNRLIAIFNMLITCLIVYMLFFKYSYPSLKMTVTGTMLFIIPMLLIALTGGINILIGAKNNKDSVSNMGLFLAEGIIEIIIGLLSYFNFLASTNSMVGIVFIVASSINFIIGLVIIFKNLNFGDRNYEFVDKPANVTFKIALIVLLLSVILPICYIFYIKSAANEVTVNINKNVPFYLIVNNAAANKIIFYDSNGNDVAQIEGSSTSQLISKNNSLDGTKLVYSIIKDGNRGKLIKVQDGSPESIFDFAITNQFVADDFLLFEEVTSSLLSRSNELDEKESEAKTIHCDRNIIQFTESPEVSYERFEYKNEEEDHFEYKYFTSNSLQDVIIQVLYYSEKKDADSFLVNKNLEGSDAFYEYKKEYYIIDKRYNDEGEYNKIDAQNLIFGGIVKDDKSNNLDSILLFDDETIPYKDGLSTGYISIDGNQKTSYAFQTIILEKNDNSKLTSRPSATSPQITLYDKDNQQKTTKSYNTVYCLNSIYVFVDPNTKTYDIYSKDGQILSTKSYTEVYSLGGNILVAGYLVYDDNQEGINYDILDSSGIINEEPIKEVDISELENIESYIYNGVYKDYIR